MLLVSVTPKGTQTDANNHTHTHTRYSILADIFVSLQITTDATLHAARTRVPEGCPGCVFQLPSVTL